VRKNPRPPQTATYPIDTSLSGSGPSYQVSVFDRTSDESATPQIVLNIRKANLNVYFPQFEWKSLQKLLSLAAPIRQDTMSMNEFCRLATKIDQHMQALAAQGVSEAHAIINRMLGV
jgi:hypothetical protein